MICNDRVETVAASGLEHAGPAHGHSDPIRKEASRWHLVLKGSDAQTQADFVKWVRQSPRHFAEFLRVSALEFENEETTSTDDFSPVEAVAERSELQNQLYLRYRRPLLQVFHHRRVDRDAADDLLQRTFLQAIQEIRTDGLDDPGNLGGYLYRTACKLATSYWRGELSLSRRHEDDRELLTNLKDEALSPEERLDHEQLAKHVRALMDHLPAQRDREVLERFYLHEESGTAIRESLQLTDLPMLSYQHHHDI